MAQSSAVEQLSAMQRGALSPLQLVEASINQIESRNPSLNAVVTLAASRARAEAERWAQAYARGDSVPPLAGLPVLIKDNQRTEGIRTTLGSERHANNIPQEDAGIVARLRAAGAIVMGKTNIPEYSIGANTVNPFFGATGNPFDPIMTCGG
ncbi:MAG: amidase family protein, partial [Pseudomonadales bacterium]